MQAEVRRIVGGRIAARDLLAVRTAFAVGTVYVEF